MKKFLKFMYDTWYGAFLFLVGVSAVQSGHNVLVAHFKYAMPGWSDWITFILSLLVIFSELSCLAAIIISFSNGKWKRALVQIVLWGMTFVVFLVVAFMTVAYEMFGPSEDHFNENLTIPADVKCEDPEKYVHEDDRQKYEDDAVFAAAMAAPKENYKEKIEESSRLYKKLFFEKNDIVLTYLRRNPLWERDKYSRKEKYTRKLWSDGQYCRITLTATRPYKDCYLAKEGCKVPEHGWYAAAAWLLDEFSKVDALKDEKEIGTLIKEPKPYVSKERPDFKLINSFQGGIYVYKATVNPGEGGEVYLKAYEVTKEYRLSATRMKQATLQRVEGKGEQVVGKEFTIYEGDWDHYYAARIEIWFVPSAGGKERKLKEKVFRVQGWMR